MNLSARGNVSKVEEQIGGKNQYCQLISFCAGVVGGGFGKEMLCVYRDLNPIPGTVTKSILRCVSGCAAKEISVCCLTLLQRFVSGIKISLVQVTQENSKDGPFFLTGLYNRTKLQLAADRVSSALRWQP